MAKVCFSVGGSTLELSTCAPGVCRFRLYREKSETLFERYGIYGRESDSHGEVTGSGSAVRCGDVTLSWNGTELELVTPRVRRVIRLAPESDRESVRRYAEKYNGFHLNHKSILGSPLDFESGEYDVDVAPCHITLDVGDDVFYGLGESRRDGLILNGRSYLQAVVYQKCEFPVPFVMTPAGYGILANTTYRHVVDVCEKRDGELLWYLPAGELDFTVFAGDTMAEVLERFTAYTGRAMMLPKWAHGLTFIDQYHADQFEVMRNAERFREKRIPCDSISLEPGWMKREYDRSVDKSWNTEKFGIWDWARGKAPAEFFFTSALKRYGFKLHLWLCCDYDFSANEERLAGAGVADDSPAWFDHLTRFANDGVDSFKMDPCRHVEAPREDVVYANGRRAPEMHNLMQTLYAKEMYRGAAEHRGIRPMHHYCGGYTGTAQYSATTTGDSGGGTATLAWCLNLGLSGVSNVTCDMIVHSIATIHYGFFTAWCQLNSWAGFDHPWWAGEDMEAAFTYYDRLRYRLLPYIYSTAIATNKTGMPVCRAMPLMFDDAECADTVSQYMFGEDLLVGAFSDEVYLPRGCRWINFWTGEELEGGVILSGTYPEGRGGALFVRAGAIIPCDLPRQYVDGRDAVEMELLVYPVGFSRRVFYEDDGVSFDYKNGGVATNEISLIENDLEYLMSIGARIGHFKGEASRRVYHVRFRTDRDVLSVECDGCATAFTVSDGFVLFDVELELSLGAQVSIRFK